MERVLSTIAASQAVIDGLGWLAAALVLATFWTRHMVALRCTAIASNVAFIGYGLLAGLDPVLMLHVLLLPLNALRLAQAWRGPAARGFLESAPCHPSRTAAPTPKPRSAS